MYAFPGGRCNCDEAPQDAAIRECLEETGVAAWNPRFFDSFDLKSDQHHYSLSAFLLDCAPDAIAFAADDAEGADWYTVAQIRQMPVPQSVLECVERLERSRISQR